MFGSGGMAERAGVEGVRVRLGVALEVLLVCVVGTMVFAGVASARWSVQPTPRLKKGDSLSGVSCVTSSDCVAVGRPNNKGRLFSERWNGRAWSLHTMPTPNPANSAMVGVSCSSRTACTAVGGSGNHMLVERWDGRKWSIQRAPSLKRRQSGLVSVSCPSKTDCIAVGNWETLNPLSTNSGPLLEGWNGSRWLIQPSPPSYDGLGYGLGAVSCSSPTACTVVGGDDGGNAFAARWNGVRWLAERAQDAPAPQYYYAGPNNELLGVSCTSSNACAAVGQAAFSPGSGSPLYEGFAELWNGKRWGHVTDTLLSDLFNGVSCASAKACLAVGDGVARWNGNRWSNVSSNGLGTGWGFNAVSCTSQTSCEAVGWTGNRPLAARWTS